MIIVDSKAFNQAKEKKIHLLTTFFIFARIISLLATNMTMLKIF